MKYIYITIILFLFATSVSFARQHPDEYYNQAFNVLNFLKHGDTLNSVDVLKDMAKEYTEDEFIQTSYGVNMFLGGEYQEAKRIFGNILLQDNKNKYANYCMGLLLLREKDVKSAFEYFDRIKNEIKDYNVLFSYGKVIEDASNEIKLTEEENINSIVFDGYVLLRSANYDDANKFFDIIIKSSGSESFIEKNGFLLSYDFNSPITVNGSKYIDNIGLNNQNKIKKNTVSGRITIKANVSQVYNIKILFFYVDDIFIGMSNSTPSSVLDTTEYSNGIHDIRIDALDYDNNIVSSTNYTIEILNLSTASENITDEYLWDDLWNFIQIKSSISAVNYMQAVCSAKLNDNDSHRFALERCVAANPEYKDAKHILKENYLRGKGNPNYNKGKTTKKKVAITFDDGPTSSTMNLLDILDSYNAKATFFVVGKMAPKRPDIIKRMADSGHQVAIHSQNHYNLTRLSYIDLEKEILQGYCSIKNCGIQPSLSMRPPGGNTGTNVKNFALEYGFNVIMWTKNTTHLQQSSANEMADYCFKSLNSGYIYLFHNNVPTTMKALPMILSYFKSMGYECVTIDELIYGK